MTIPLQTVRYYGMIVGMNRAKARDHLFAHASRRSQETGQHRRPVSVRMAPDTWTAIVRDPDPDEADSVSTWHPLHGGPDRLHGVPVITDQSLPFGELRWRWPE